MGQKVRPVITVNDSQSSALEQERALQHVGCGMGDAPSKKPIMRDEPARAPRALDTSHTHGTMPIANEQVLS